MAIYHLTVKTISRNAGQSVVAAAAYRAGEKITDERSGEVKDFERKTGVEGSEIHLPKDAPEELRDRAKLWNAAESAEKRKDSVTGREVEMALPHELDAKARRALANDFARHIVQRYGVAVDVSIHAPGRGGDERNHHAHLLLTSRRVGPEGFGEKTRELDVKTTSRLEVQHLREEWERWTNRALELKGIEAKVDHRSLETQGVEQVLPTRHMGPAATALERKGIETEIGRENRRFKAVRAMAAARAAKREAARQVQDLARPKDQAHDQVQQPTPPRLNEAARVDLEKRTYQQVLGIYETRKARAAQPAPTLESVLEKHPEYQEAKATFHAAWYAHKEHKEHIERREVALKRLSDEQAQNKKNHAFDVADTGFWQVGRKKELAEAQKIFDQRDKTNAELAQAIEEIRAKTEPLARTEDEAMKAWSVVQARELAPGSTTQKLYAQELVEHQQIAAKAKGEVYVLTPYVAERKQRFEQEKKQAKVPAKKGRGRGYGE